MKLNTTDFWKLWKNISRIDKDWFWVHRLLLPKVALFNKDHKVVQILYRKLLFIKERRKLTLRYLSNFVWKIFNIDNQ